MIFFRAIKETAENDEAPEAVEETAPMFVLQNKSTHTHIANVWHTCHTHTHTQPMNDETRMYLCLCVLNNRENNNIITTTYIECLHDGIGRCAYIRLLWTGTGNGF